MKTLFLSLLLFISVNAQSELLTLFADDGITYSAEAQQYFDRLPTAIPDDTLTFYAEFIDSMVSRNYWDRVDEMWWIANKTVLNALIGLKGLSDADTNGAYTFTPYQGLAGNGSTGYINTGFNPSTATNFKQNTSTFGVYSRTNSEAAVTDMGVSDGTNYTALQIRKATNIIRGWCNQGVATTSPANTTSLGFFTVTRIGANAWFNAKNGSNLTGGTQASTAIPNFNLYICAQNASNTASAFSTREYSFAMVGDDFSLPEQVIITGFIETLLDHLGVGVIP